MRHRVNFIAVFLFILLHIQPMFAQNIGDYFCMLPDSSALGLSSNKRKEMIKDFVAKTEPTDALYRFDVLDVKNGFLKVTGAIEGHFEMCYWNRSDGSKLIAVYQEGCGPVCIVEQFEFYTLRNGKLMPENFSKIIPDVYDDFFLGNAKEQKKKLEHADIIITLLYRLPQSGKNIIARWGNEETDDVYRKWAKGTYMELLWNDGVFTKSEVIWK
jgi:hypothetical protein